MTVAGSHIRVLLAWLIAMQPILGTYAAAHAARAPLSMELCGGAQAAPDRTPDQSRDHAQCCIACTAADAPPVESALVSGRPADRSAGNRPCPDSVSVPQAGLGPQAARAPPL